MTAGSRVDTEVEAIRGKRSDGANRCLSHGTSVVGLRFFGRGCEAVEELVGNGAKRDD